MKVFAFRNEKRVEEKSSSGGAFMAVIDAAFKLCKTGGGSESVTIYGAVFNNDLEVVHSKATTIAECEKFHGSKYVLSSMGQNYKEVENVFCFQEHRVKLLQLSLFLIRSIYR